MPPLKRQLAFDCTMLPYTPAPLPANEAARLEKLRSYGVLDTDPEQTFDDITALATHMLGVPIALVSLVDSDRQWFKSRVGLDAPSTGRDVAFCAHTILCNDVMVVEDALADTRFARNPLVTGAPHIRFYAGCPLLTPDGFALGTLCLIDTQPRAWTEREADVLRRLGRQLMQLLELRHALRLKHEAEQQLLQRHREFERLALVAERTHNVVIMADPMGLITWVNAAFERITGYTMAEVVGQQPGKLLQCENTSPEARRTLGQAVRHRTPARVHILNRGKHGNLYWMDVDLQPIHDNGGAFVGFVAMETDISDLVRQQEHLNTIIETVPVGLALQNHALQTERKNNEARRILEAQGHVDNELPTELLQLAKQARDTGREVPRQLIQVQSGTGLPRWMDARVAVLPGATGQFDGLITAFSDQTEQVQAGRYIELATHTADVGYWTWSLREDHLELSDSWVKRLGLAQSGVSSKTLVHPDDQERCKRAIRQVLQGEVPTFKMEERLRTGDGQWRWVLCGGAVTERDANGRVTRMSGIHLDIDDQKRTEIALHRAATTDALTGLPNRAVVLDRLARAMKAAQRHGQCGAVLYLDLDHFKRINDSLGHSAGDQVLQNVASRLVGLLREEDTLARMGGDEMLLLLPQLGHSLETARESAFVVGHKLLKALDRPLNVAGRELVLGASIGIALFPKNGDETSEDLVREADTAMYGAKSEMRGTLRLYEPSMQNAVALRMQLEHDLRQALAKQELQLFVQGKWSPEGVLCGGEALLRWRHATRDWVSPAVFIPVAEESELIIPLGQWVLEQACVAARYLRAQQPDFVLSVNISPNQLRHAGFAAQLQTTVARAGLPPEALMLEITEGVLLQDQLARQVVALSECGYRFSLDDFGTGYSSLAYLKRLPVHELKIDRAFVRDLETDREDAALVQAILTIAKRFKIRTVAEGVETPAQAAFLAAHGCELLQGFLFDKPQAWQQFAAQHQAAPH